SGLRNPASLGYQPKPSVVWAFAAPIPRLTLLRSKARGPPSMADPFAGTKVHWTFVLFRLTPVPLVAYDAPGIPPLSSQ
ncbi:MAG: hypothetical protein V3S33_01455, partial [Gammaproteobacteria bacterium]